MSCKLYYIWGNKQNPEGVMNALRWKGIKPAFPIAYFMEDDELFYGCEGTPSLMTSDKKSIQLIGKVGTQLTCVDETPMNLKAGDMVITKFGPDSEWTIDMFSHIRDHYDCVCLSGRVYRKNIHKYEPWMAKYLGTSMSFCDMLMEHAGQTIPDTDAIDVDDNSEDNTEITDIPENLKSLKADDLIMVRYGDTDWTLDHFSYSYYRDGIPYFICTSGKSYSRHVVLYRPWMSKYLGTRIQTNEFKKSENDKTIYFNGQE